MCSDVILQKVRSEDDILDLMTYLDKTRTIFVSLHSRSLLHPTLIGSLTPQLERSARIYEVFGAWVKLLKEEEYDFEQLDKTGSTALLAHLECSGAESLVWTTVLLDSGANAHALAANGENALQFAMRSSFDEQHRDVLEQKLYLLIRAGVDVNHRCSHGLTPSMDARQNFYCWIEWCNALSRNSLNILHVVEAETRSLPWEGIEGSGEEDSEDHGFDNDKNEIELTFG